jgi:hypothetical protein
MGTDARTVIVEVTPEKGSVYGVGHPRSRGLQVGQSITPIVSKLIELTW